MSEQNLDKFIDGLADDLAPVKPLAHPLVRIAPLFVVAAAYVVGVSYFIGLRSDIGDKFTDPSWMLETFLMGFISISAAIASSFLSVPDMRGAKWVVAPPLTTLAIFVVWNIFRAISEGLHMPNIHFDHCMGEGMFMAAVPMTMLIFMIKRGATTRPRITCFMNILTASSLGYIGLRFTCSLDTVGHATVSHLIPYVVIGAFLGAAAKKLYKW